MTSADDPDSVMSETVRLIGDAWTLLILWSAMRGVTRFDCFQKRLGLARNILSNRLGRLVSTGLMEKRPVHPGARRMEYRLTARGRALGPVLTHIEAWGREHLETAGSASADQR